jgi:thiol:disulfide interchange protein
MTASKLKSRRQNPSQTPQLLIISGVILLIVMILIIKQYRNSTDELVPSAGELPEEQLDRALKDGEPTLAFFHSSNCHQCIVMIETVSQVYPEFSSTVTLVDVDVYNEDNAALLQRVDVRYIPTLIFFDHTGKGQVSVGVMESAQLQQTLAGLVGGD